MSTSHQLPGASTILETSQAPALPDLAGLHDKPMIDSEGNCTLYSSLDGASSVLPKNGQHFIVSAKKNNTKGAGVNDGWEVHCVVPSFASDIASLGDWSELVNSALLAQAKDSLKQWRTNNPMSYTVPVAMFTSAQLREDYLAGGDSGSMTREQLELAFTRSATWLRISGSDKFKVSSQYRTIADLFKQRVLALSGRSHGAISDADLDKILAKIEEDDFVTPFGSFVIRKIQQIRKQREEGGSGAIDINDL